MQYLGTISVCFQGKPFSITVIQVYAPTSNAKEAEVEWFYEDLEDLLELFIFNFYLFSLSCVRLFETPWTVAYQAPLTMGFSRQEYWSGLPHHPKCPFHHRRLECKTRKTRDTWSNRQVWCWSIKWSRAKASRVFPREHSDHCKQPLPTTQEKTLPVNITRWSVLKSDWFCSLQPKMEKFYTVSKNKTGNWMGLRS